MFAGQFRAAEMLVEDIMKEPPRRPPAATVREQDAIARRGSNGARTGELGMAEL